MSDFYVKNEDGKFIPVKLNKLLGKELDKSLVVVKVGSDENPATMEDLEATQQSFLDADIIDDLDLSIIITPFQIEIGMVEKEEDLDYKQLYLQVSSGTNISELDEATKNLYKRIKDKYNVTVLPVPLTYRDYKKMKDVLTRCKIRQSRRGRTKG